VGVASRGRSLFGENADRAKHAPRVAMKKSLLNSALQSAVLIIPLILTFVAAGTIHFWQGWLFWAVFMLLSSAMGIYLRLADPALLARRMKAGPQAESRPREKIIMMLTITMFYAMAVVPGLDHRFGWSRVPAAVVIGANLLIVVAFAVFIVVLRANTYAASTITVEAGQHVVSTGPYAIVRHPMYTGGLLLLVATPLAMGSWWGLIPAIAASPALIARIFDEESALIAELPGYDAYCRAVPFRLVPRVW
jgi:protein-S-isoprenylcysteine O-methyltransferase Ste14